MSERELTEKQLKFIELIFLPEYTNKVKQAALDAGYSPATDTYAIMYTLKEEILTRMDYYLAQHAPQCVNRVLDVLINPEQKGAKSVLDAAAMILDRAGISKKERIEVEHKAASGVLILPAKKD